MAKSTTQTVTFEPSEPPKSTRGRTSSIPKELAEAVAERLLDSDGWLGSSERFNGENGRKEAGNRAAAFKRAMDGLIDVQTRIGEKNDGYTYWLRAKPAAESEG